ncbi:MAG: amino acid permease [Roseibium sp.]|nr:amino acid permease [Roseibium sp.]
MKDLSELPCLHSMELEEHGLPKNWAFCCGGADLDSDQWAIKHVHEDLSEDLYPLPHWVTVLLQWNRAWEREAMQSQLRNILGLEQ